jgi:hypothetical protein
LWVKGRRHVEGSAKFGHEAFPKFGGPDFIAVPQYGLWGAEQSKPSFEEPSGRFLRGVGL